jgi:L-lactate dehydrogenase complex protein LldG
MKMSEAREAILGRLRARQTEARQPGVWASQRDFPDLMERFAAALTATGGEVFVEADLAAAVVRLDEVLQALGAERVVATQEAPLDGLDLPARLPVFVWNVAGEDRDGWRAFCSRADVGVSGAEAALAETGTVVGQSGAGRSRLATLLPPVHVVLLPEERLVSDIFAWAARGEGLPASVTLISGPSKTADIEQTLAVGVHGPRRLIVIGYR